MNPTISVHDLFGVWPSIEQSFLRGLPYTRLTWQQSTGVLHTIPVLDVEIKPYLVSEGNDFINDIKLLSEPVLNIFAVKCDDVEIYRQHVRQLLKEWHNNVSSKPGQEWMIIFIVANDPAFNGGSGSKTSNSKSLSSKNAVYEKIRSDFNPSNKVEHCVQIRLGDGRLEMAEAIEGLHSKAKSLILSSIAIRIDLIKQSLLDSSGTATTIETMKMTFVQKENLALIYETLGLFTEALALYDQLEVSLRKQNENVAASFPEVNIAQTKSREQLMESDTNPVELIVRVSHQQQSLLTKAGQFPELLARAFAWLSKANCLESASWQAKFIQDCRVSQMIEDLLFSIPTTAYDAEVATYKADLEVTQKAALKRLTLRLFHSQGQASDMHEARELLETTISHETIRQVLVSEASFSEHLNRLNEAILVDYKFAERSRDVELLHVELAKQNYLAGDFDTALNEFEFAREWVLSNVGQTPGEDACDLYLQCLLKVGQLSTFTEACLEVLAGCKDANLCKKLVDDIESVRNGKDINCEVDFADYAIPYISRYASSPAQTHAIRIKVDIKNLLPVAWQATSTKLSLINNEGLEWEFQSSQQVIGLGITSYEVMSNDYKPGIYRVNSLLINWGSICFIQYFSGSRATLAVYKSPPPVTLRLEREHEIFLDKPRSLCLLMKTGLVNLANCSIKINSEQQGLNLDRSAFMFSLAGQSKVLIPPSDGMLGELAAEKSYDITLPYDVNFSDKVTTLIVNLEYYIDGNLCSMTQQVKTELSLPLSVNVQDFFRLNSLLCKFQISGARAGSYRLLERTLESSESHIVRQSEGQSESCLLIEDQPCISVFQISQKLRNANHALCLTLRFRAILDEMRSVLSEYFTNSQTFNQLSTISQGIMLNALETFMRTFETRSSILLGRVHLGIRNSQFWQPWLEFLNQTDRKLADELLDTLHMSKDLCFQAGHSDELDHFMHIPVAIPSNVVVHEVSLEPQPAGKLITIAQELDIHMKIQSTLNWCDTKLPVELFFMYELQMDDNDWVLCGSRRGTFHDLSKVDLIFQLIPLRAGHIVLPTIDIHCSNPEIISETQLLSVNSHLLVGDHDRLRTIQI